MREFLRSVSRNVARLRSTAQPRSGEDDRAETDHVPISRAHWEKWNALAAMIGAIATFGLLAFGIYLQFWSDLPGDLKKISDLSGQNQKLYADASAAQTTALKAQTAALNSQRQVNDAIARAVNAETGSTGALLESMTARERAEEASRKAGDLEKSVAGLRTESAALAARNAKAQKDLTEAEGAATRITDATVTLLHDNRYKQFTEQMGRSSVLLIPTNQSVADQAASETVMFSIMDRKANLIDDADIKAAKGVTIDDVGVVGFTMSIAASETAGMHMQFKFLDSNDPRFVKFVSLLKSKPAMDALTFISMQQFGGIPDIARPRVIDVLRTQFPGKQFAIGFLPGNIGGMSYEDWLIRGFWVNGVGDQLSRMSHALRSLQKQMDAVSPSDFNIDTGMTFNVSKPQWDDALKQIRDTFGPKAMKRMQRRLSQLDDNWVQQLSSGDIEFRTNVAFTLDKDKHASQVFGRWNWSESDENLSLLLFDTIEEKGRADFVLACTGGAFLEANHLSVGPEAPSTLATCRQSGTGGVPGGRTMVFVDFVGQGGADLSVSCDQIKGTASSPSGYKYDFSPLAFDPDHENSLCSSMLLVPEGEPITIAATAPGLVGRPASSAPAGQTRIKAPEIGWSNPTVFLSKDHEPSAHRRIMEMQPLALPEAH